MNLNLTIILIYLFIIIAVGLAGVRWRDSLDGFLLAQRKAGLNISTFSICATILGGSSTVGIAGLGFEIGLVGVWWLLVGSVGLIILGSLFASNIRKKKLYTLPELVGRIYGEKMRMASSILIAISWLGVISAQIVASGRLLKIISVLPLGISMFICTLLFLFYTLLGGQRSVLRTDYVQFIILYGVVCLIGLPMILGKVGGIGGLKDALKPSLFSFPTNEFLNLGELFGLLLMVGTVYVVGPDIYSRIFSVRDARCARKAPIYAGIIIIPFAFSIVLLGLCARALAPHINAEEAIPFLITHHMPLLLGGLLIISFLAAFMSSADTCLLTSSTILAMDVCRARKGIVSRIRINIVVIGILSFLLALYLQKVISVLLVSYSIFTSGVALPLIMGFYKERFKLNEKGALASLIGGGTTALYLYLVRGRSRLIDISGLIPLMVSIVLLFGVSWISGIRKKDYRETRN